MYHILNTKGPVATPKEIASHYNVIMMAGAVTTATFLSGTLYYLCSNISALWKLQNELRTTFKSLEAITSRTLMQCTYLNAVVEEGLRIYPPAGAAHLSRIVPEGGCEISGRFIPAGVCFSPHPLAPFEVYVAPQKYPRPRLFIMRTLFSNLLRLMLCGRLGSPSTLGLSFGVRRASMHLNNLYPKDGSRMKKKVKRAISSTEVCRSRTVLEVV